MSCLLISGFHRKARPSILLPSSMHIQHRSRTRPWASGSTYGAWGPGRQERSAAQARGFNQIRQASSGVIPPSFPSCQVFIPLPLNASPTCAHLLPKCRSGASLLPDTWSSITHRLPRLGCPKCPQILSIPCVAEHACANAEATVILCALECLECLNQWHLSLACMMHGVAGISIA